MSSARASGRILSSDWSGLSRHLIARFYPVRAQGYGESRVYFPDGEISVEAPLIDPNMEVNLNWQSPFENMSPDQARPALTAMLQSGAIQPFLMAMQGETDEDGNQPDLNAASGVFGKVSDLARRFEGRTGITKLNSTQVFSGMPPVKISLQLVFRAWKDPQREVEAPFQQLMRWALPKELSVDGAVTSLAKGEKAPEKILMPSLAPTLMAMEYKRRRYVPMVIESITEPMNSPVDSSGTYTELVVQMTLASLTAIDGNDYRNMAVSGADTTIKVN